MSKSVELRMAERPAEAALEAVRVAPEKAAQSLGDAGYISVDVKANLDAAAAASKASLMWARALSHEIFIFANSSIHAQLAAGEAMVRATSLNDTMTVRQAHIEDSYRCSLALEEKLRTMMLAAANDVTGPISRQAEDALEAWNKKVA